MFDLKFIREHEKEIKDSMSRRDLDINVLKDVLEKDKRYRDLKEEVDSLRHERNVISEKINEAKKKNQDVKPIIEKARKIPEQLASIEKELKQLEEEIVILVAKIPNILDKNVPRGKDPSGNKVLRKWGKIPKFSFNVKTHVELAESLGIADFDASAETSGKGFYYLKGDLALLNQALLRFAIDFMRSKKYEYIEPPLMIRKDIVAAAGDLNAFKDALYKIEGEDLYLIPTAEHALLGMLRDKTIPEGKLPLKLFGYSMSFRKEIGAHGINEKGLWRTHQFNKVEQFVFCKPKDSEEYYDELLANTEGMMKKLQLPYRVLEMCTGDLSIWKIRSADIEVYRPTLKEYGETMSVSNCGSYQSMDLKIKGIDKNGEKYFLHTLNNTAIATSRIMVAILENNQQKDGTVKVPTVLQKYIGKKILGTVKKIKGKKVPKKAERKKKK
ncbi:MAG: serine--tRNA ligase [Candidatus Pacearchaeota archaeon]|nr:serine--tRNA ligase [Candidatus Pacearchaeota archaeon]